MNNPIKIGTTESGKPFGLPLDAATQTFAFIARKGAGKTYGAGKLTEQLLKAGVQVVVLDTVGNWYGLRLAADGKGEGFDVPVFGGLRGDLPLEAAAGELVADVIVDSGRSVILDASQFSLHDRKRFAAAFGERLWTRKKGESHPSPLMLVIEESQLVVPQFPGPAEARMVGIYEEIIRLGRNYGIGVTMISQRPQSVNKEVLNQTECLFVGQVNGSQERDALKKWITHQGMDKNLVDELPSLPIGTMYVWSPQWLKFLEKVQIGKKHTLDSTSTPRVGQKQTRREPKPLDLADLKVKMQGAIERAKADDPRELRKIIADLKSQLAARPTVDQKDIKHAQEEAFALARKQAAVIAKSAAQIIVAASDSLTKAAALLADLGVNAEPPRVENASTPARVFRVAHPSDKVQRNGNGDLPVGEKAVLSACIQFPAGLRREQLTVLTGYKRSTRDAYIQRLRERTYVEVRGDAIVATESGTAAIPDAAPLPTGEELQRFWLNRLPEGERAILAILLEAHPNSIVRDAITEKTGYKRSTRDAYLYRMSSKQLVMETARGEVKASDELFE